MIESLGIEHLFDLTAEEKILAFFTPLIIFAAFAVAQIALAARTVTGYVTNAETGQPRSYRLNGLLVFAIMVIIWATEATGMPRDWFYRSSLWAVFGGTVFTVIFSLIAVFGQPQGEVKNPIIAFYLGRKQEFSFFNEYFDVKMWFYVVGGAMLSLNALSGAVWHHENFADANLGVFLYAGIYTFYITDYFIWERVQLYTYDLIHENTGFKLFWGGLVVYGWLFILPLWAMANQPDPGFSAAAEYAIVGGAAALFLTGWTISRGASLQKYWFKRWPDRKFLWFEPEVIEAGNRKILCSGFWGAARHFNYFGEGLFGLAIALSFGHFGNPWAWSYMIFVVTMFTWRQIEDDRACAEKYGPEKWAEYQQRVPWRIVPRVY
ncbi:MAG: DUF1295 domain-containing protein [Chloroflexi bacterium]|nr:DUF1295 domain-containing protein [Chloroflexota bacterium]MYI05326.1 DUF1295 domain-containing protein [Chloroflexota bacterium]